MATTIAAARAGETVHPSLETLISDVLITPHFQPIVDLFAGTAIAWEVLSRGAPPERIPLRAARVRRRRVKGGWPSFHATVVRL